MKVVFGITSRSWGGNEKWAAEAARGLARRDHKVTALWSYEPVLRELSARGVPASASGCGGTSIQSDSRPS